MNRVDRLLAMILLLQSKRVVTAEEIAAHFELSVRTVYRDLAALGEAGVPILAEAGVGYSLVKGYHLPPVSFTTEEANALAAGVTLVEQFADESLRTPIQSAFLKIRSVLPRERQEQLYRLSQRMHARGRDFVGAQLAVVQRALAEQRVLHVLYQGAGKVEATARVIEPMGLIYYLERWHLIAWCRIRHDYRDFRVDRMREVELSSEPFTPKPEFSLKKFVDEKMRPSGTQLVQLKFSPLFADRARRESSYSLVTEAPAPDGVVFTLAVCQLDWVARWLLSFGREVCVIGPVELRERIVAVARDAEQHHGGI